MSLLLDLRGKLPPRHAPSHLTTPVEASTPPGKTVWPHKYMGSRHKASMRCAVPVHRSLHFHAIETPVRRHFGVVVHVAAVEAEQLEELVLVAGIVGDLPERLGGDGRPQRLAGVLHVGAQ